jgi:hypothetical protein
VPANTTQASKCIVWETVREENRINGRRSLLGIPSYDQSINNLKFKYSPTPDLLPSSFHLNSQSVVSVNILICIHKRVTFPRQGFDAVCGVGVARLKFLSDRPCLLLSEGPLHKMIRRLLMHSCTYSFMYLLFPDCLSVSAENPKTGHNTNVKRRADPAACPAAGVRVSSFAVRLRRITLASRRITLKAIVELQFRQTRN